MINVMWVRMMRAVICDLLSGGEIPNTQFGIRSKYHRGPLIFGFGNLGVAGIYYQIPYSQIDHEFFFVLGDPVC